MAAAKLWEELRPIVEDKRFIRKTQLLANLQVAFTEFGQAETWAQKREFWALSADARALLGALQQVKRGAQYSDELGSIIDTALSMPSLAAAPTFPNTGGPTPKEYEAAFATACTEYGFEHIAGKLPWEVLARFSKLLTEKGEKPAPTERKPGEGWQISPETHREIEAIERNQREARANMSNILVGAKEGDTP